MSPTSPMTPENLESHISEIHAAFASLRPLRSRRILVIDESPAVRKRSETQLSQLGCSVVGTGDGLAGLEMGLSGTFDVVVVTENLPGISGVAICRILSVLSSERRPLIIFNAAESLSQSQARSAGADLLLSHDAEGDNLVDWVRVYLASHPARKGRGIPAAQIHNSFVASLAAHPSLAEDHAWAGSGIV